MGSKVSWRGIAVILIASTFAVAARGAAEEMPPFNVDEFLNGPDRKDFSWQVWVEKPYLTLQQRYLVVVGATINCKGLKSKSHRRNMHFVIKVGNFIGKGSD
jgi:hypothetical protein